MSAVTPVIDFERDNPTPGHRKEVRIRIRFGWSNARYYQRLNSILTTKVLLTQALEHDPTTTHRLLRQIEERAAARLARKVAPE